MIKLPPARRLEHLPADWDALADHGQKGTKAVNGYGKCLRAISDHVDSVRSVALTPDSRVLATASHDCAIQVWDIDWEYDFPGWKERDERILPILRLFLETHRPFGPDGIRRHGQPTWTTNDVAILLERLQHCGLGFVQEDAVEESLRSLASVYVLRPGARINDWQ